MMFIANLKDLYIFKIYFSVIFIYPYISLKYISLWSHLTLISLMPLFLFAFNWYIFIHIFIFNFSLFKSVNYSWVVFKLNSICSIFQLEISALIYFKKTFFFLLFLIAFSISLLLILGIFFTPLFFSYMIKLPFPWIFPLLIRRTIWCLL